MKKQKRTLPADNGISVSCRMCTKEKVSLPVLNDILLVLLSMLTAVSAVMTFATVLDFSISPEIIIPATMGFCLVFGIVFKLVKKFKFLVFIAALLIAGVAFIVLKDNVIKGSVILYDQAMQTISSHMAWDEVVPTYVWQDSYVELTNTVLVLFSFLLCSLISYFTVVKQSFIATLLLTFPFFEAGAAVGAVPNRLYFGMMLASWTASLTISRVANAKIKSKQANGKAKRVRAHGTRGKFAASAVSIAAITLCIFLGSSSFLSYLGISRSENVDEFRLDAKNIVSSVYDYITGKDNDGSLKEGKLLEVDDRRIKNRHYITMQIFVDEVPSFVKLKGYTGSVYKNNEWGQIENYDEYQVLFDEISDAGYNAASLKGSILTSHPNCFSEFNFATVGLSEFRRRKNYVYETYYGSFTPDEFTSNYDTSAKSKNGNGDYVYLAVFPSSEDGERLAKSPLYSDSKFKSLWSRYGDMVEKEYTASFATDSVSSLAAGFKTKREYEIVDNIRQYFKDEFKHTFAVDKSPKDRDFVEHFLFTTKSGYSTHFATAATVMLQSQGIPTRYVEGYFIPQKYIEEAEKNELGASVVDITDAYAHAWIEVYDEDFGWIPVEVTPGYWSGSFADEMDIYKEALEEPKEEEPTESEPTPEEPETEEPGTPDVENDPSLMNPDGDEDAIGVAPPWIWATIRIVILLIVFVVLFIIWHNVRKAIRRKKLYKKDAQTSIKASYKYFLSLARYEGIDCDNIYSFMDFAKLCAQKSAFIKEESVERFMGIYLKNTYSKNKATMDEAVINADFVCAYSERIYYSLPFFKKLVFKFIKNL